MKAPLLTRDLIERLRRRDFQASLARINAVRAIPGNPFGAQARYWGSALATIFDAEIVRGKNRVMGLEAEGLGDLDEMLDLFRENGTNCSISVYEEEFADRFRSLLAAKDVHQTGINCILYGRPVEAQAISAAAVSTREMLTDEQDLFMELFRVGNDIGEQVWERLKTFESAENTEKDYRLFVAEVGDVAAAVGSLCTYDNIGGLAAASTLPTFRGKGCQTALIHRRIDEAARSGCDLVVSHASRFSTSHNNLERAGLRLACFGSTWKDFKQLN